MTTMQSILKLVPLAAARRVLGAAGPAAGDPSGTVRQGPARRGQLEALTRATAMFAPGSASPRWRWAMTDGWLTDAQVADWPVVPPRDGDATGQPDRRSR